MAIAGGTVLLLCVGAIALLAFTRFAGAAKRKAPPRIKPVIIGSVEYRVPNTIETEGIVEAWNTNSQRLLWKRKIYPTLKFPSMLMETDVQLNFITNMAIGPSTNELTIANEKGRQYILNTLSQTVKRK